MRSNGDKKSTMSSSAQVLGLTRSAAAALVEREERRTGSRMAAYHNVGAMVGASSSWIRKFVTERPEVKTPDLTTGWNILETYRRVCGRIEAEAENERAKAQALKRQIDAADAGITQLVAMEKVTSAPRENP